MEEKSCYQSVMERIHAASGTRTQIELAILLEIRQSSISDSTKRKSIPSAWILTLFRKLGVNPDWIETGTGPMYLRTEKGYGAFEDSNSVASAHMIDPQANPVVVPVFSTQCRWDKGKSPESDIIGRLALPRSHVGEHIRVYRTDSSALAPLIRKGAHVGVDTSQRHPVSGELFAVAMSPEGILFRRLWSQASQFSAEAGASQLVLRAEQPGYSDTILSTKTFLKCVVGKLAWSFQTY